MPAFVIVESKRIARDRDLGIGLGARYAIGRPEAENIGVPGARSSSAGGGMSFFIEHPESRARWRPTFATCPNPV